MPNKTTTPAPELLPRRPMGLATVALALCAAALAACASRVQVSSLATGQARVQAFELRGDDPDALRREAARLCGGSAEVLRDSVVARQLPPPSEGRIARWMNLLQSSLTPSDRSAQLTVLCPPQDDRQRASDARPLPAATAADKAAVARLPWGY